MSDKCLFRVVIILTSLVILFSISLVIVPIIDINNNDGIYADNKRELVVVSLGDSYSSGEGVEKFYGQDKKLLKKVADPDWLAHRSQESWPGRMIIQDGGKPLKNQRGKNWFFAAASGATTKDIAGYKLKSTDKGNWKMYNGKIITKDSANPVIGQEKFFNKYLPVSRVYIGSFVVKNILSYKDVVYLPPQLDIFNQLGDKKADYVTLTLGGNDAEFGNVISDVVAGGSFFRTSALPNRLKKVWKKFYAKNGIRANLKKAYKAIEKKAGKQATIVVAGYPTLFENSGRGPFSTETEAKMVNESVSDFNTAIADLVGECQSEGMDITFVDVNGGFKGKQAYSSDPYINPIYLSLKFSQDINDSYYSVKKRGGYRVKSDLASSYSMHPNKKGIKIYADYVQKEIRDIEGKKQNGTYKKGKPKSDERDVVLVLDNSDSMGGSDYVDNHETPLDKTKTAANKFVDTVLNEKARVGVVQYSTEAQLVCPFTTNANTLKDSINRIETDSMTNIEDGLAKAKDMLASSSAKKKIIVLMSDGVPNEGLLGDELIEYANQLKKEGYYVYTLGFFENAEDITSAQWYMENIASEGCHYEVDDPNNLVFFFGDIADQINGQKYMYVRIACPVDVTVTSNGETLNSAEDQQNTRTSFGSITFENQDTQSIDDISDYSDDNDGGDDPVKIIRLKEGTDYDVHIDGTGVGKMNYSIGFMNENGEYSDFRKFNNIKIGKRTKIDTVANVSPNTELKVDKDGDGKYDIRYKARANEVAKIVKEPSMGKLILFIIVFISCIALMFIMIVLLRKSRKAESLYYNDYGDDYYNNDYYDDYYDDYADNDYYDNNDKYNY